MCWKMIRSEGWRFLFTNFQVNIIRKFFKRTRDASPICLLLRSICTGLSYLALSEPLILKKLIGFIPLYTPPVTWHQMASLYPLSHHEWWEVQYNLFLQTGLIGTEQRELIISLWFPMILRLVFITKYEFRIQFLKFIVHITLSATLSIPILHIYHVTCSFFLLFCSRKRRQLKEGFFHCCDVPPWYKHLDRGIMCAWKMAQLPFLLMLRHRKCIPTWFLIRLPGQFLCTSEDCFMMLEMTPKVVTMQGRYYYRYKLQMRVWVRILLFIIILCMHKNKNAGSVSFYQKSNTEWFWYIFYH